MTVFLRILEAGVVRALPGITSLVALLLLADRIEPDGYGHFSTIWATTLFVTSLAFGLVSQAIVPCHSSYASSDKAKRFEEQVIGASLIISTFFLCVGGVSAIAGRPILTACALIAVGTGTLQVIQQILQARIAIWRYGIVSFAQSVSFLAGLYFLGDEHLRIVEALHLFALSQVPALVLAFAFLGAPRAAKPTTDLLSEFTSIGAPLTMGSLAENSLITCFRWLLAFWANPELLSAFSFAIDLGQRSVAVVLNLIGFALIPRAYRQFADDPDDRRFRNSLQRSAVSGALVSGALVVAILVVAGSGKVPALAQPTFVPWIFVTIAAAAVVNRTKKVAVDPIAIRRRQASTIVSGYMVGGATALTAATLALRMNYAELVVPVYLAGYCVATIVTVLASQRQKAAKERAA